MRLGRLLLTEGFTHRTTGANKVIDSVFVPNEAKLSPNTTGSYAGKSWEPVAADVLGDGCVDVNAGAPEVDYAIAYLVANIYSPEDVNDYVCWQGPTII